MNGLHKDAWQRKTSARSVSGIRRHLQLIYLDCRSLIALQLLCAGAGFSSLGFWISLISPNWSSILSSVRCCLRCDALGLPEQVALLSLVLDDSTVVTRCPLHSSLGWANHQGFTLMSRALWHRKETSSLVKEIIKIALNPERDFGSETLNPQKGSKTILTYH